MLMNPQKQYYATLKILLYNSLDNPYVSITQNNDKNTKKESKMSSNVM